MILSVIRPIDPAHDAARHLQTSVLRPDGPLPGDKAPPASALTIAASDDDGVVGAVTIAPEAWPRHDQAELPAGQWHLRSLAVSPRARGHGVGGQLVAAAADVAREAGGSCLWAEIRVAALPVYLRQGWLSIGDVWDKPGVGPHRYGWIALT